jgi:hypothetical protein
MKRLLPMTKNQRINKIVVKIQNEIRETAPASVAGMNYGKSWVFEEVTSRIGEEDPTLCSDEVGFEGIAPWNAVAAKKGLYGPFPELECVALEITKKFLPDINELFPTLQDRKLLCEEMRELI